LNPRHKNNFEAAVLDAAVRTFVPVESQTIRWNFPLWAVAEDFQPVLKQEATRGDSRQTAKDQQGVAELLSIVRKADKPTLSRYAIRTQSGGCADRVNRLIRLSIQDGHLEHAGTDKARNGKPMDLFSLPREEKEFSVDELNERFE
jgi:hypothetical protein